MPCNCNDETLREDIITTDDDKTSSRDTSDDKADTGTSDDKADTGTSDDKADTGTSDDKADTGTSDEIVDRLKVYLENKFSALSRVFNNEDYVIPEIFEYSVEKDVDYDYVYKEDSKDSANQRYIITLLIGKARYRIVGNEEKLQRKVLDTINGFVMALRCGLEVVE